MLKYLAKHCLLVVGSVLMISACGGGGDSSGNTGGSGTGNNPAPITIAVTGSNAITLQENGSVTVTFTVTNAQNTPVITLTPTGTHASALTVKTVDTYRFTLQGVEFDGADKTVPVQARVVDGHDSSRAATVTLNVTVENTSANNLLADIDTFLASEARLKAMTEENAVIAALRELGTLYGIDVSARDLPGTQEHQAIESAVSAASLDMTTIFLEQFRHGIINEATLRQHFHNALAMYRANDNLDALKPYRTALLSLFGALPVTGSAELTLERFYVHNGGLSLFTGNPALGAVNADGVFEFKSEYRYLAGLLNVDCAVNP